MKLLAYAIFAISVLLFSGLARAAVSMPFVNAASYQTPIHVEQVSFQPEQKQVTLAGNLPNPCIALPSASLIQDQKNPGVLTIRLSSPMQMDICIERIQPYMTTLDLPTLARASQVTVDPKATYVIRTEGYDFEMQVQGSDLVR